MKAFAGKLHHFTRILTLPSFVTGVTVLLLYAAAHAMTATEFIVSESCLLVIPLLAYPVREIFKIGPDRRSGQRSTAMIFSAVGYFFGFIWTLFVTSSLVTKVLFTSYVISVAALLILNKVLHFKASGHACSTTAPTILLPWQLSLLYLIPCLALIVSVYVSSIRLGRHTLRQLLAGSAVSVTAVIVSILIY